MRWSKCGFHLPLVAIFCCALPLLPAAQYQPQNAAPQTVGPQQTPSPPQQPGKAEPFVLVDPGHGGDDKGAVFSGRINEKDITLSLGRELHKKLEERGIPVKMLRDADVNISLDRRAELANEPHTALYIGLHAGLPGKGVRVYAPLLPSTESADGRFLPWDSAQMTSLERSRRLAQAVAKELQKRNIPVRMLASPLRPLNNIVPPAIAVELATDEGNVRSLESEKTQAAVASAIAAAIGQRRTSAGGQL
jgi:N-acetylmuramoyl-L-alanine amidase